MSTWGNARKEMSLSRLVLVVALVIVASPGAGRAVTFAVDATRDDVDVSPGNGLCETAAGDCTLRAAVQEANARAGADTIALPAGSYVLTLTGSSPDPAATGDLDLIDDVTIIGDGPGTTVIETPILAHVFAVTSGAEAALSHLAVYATREAILNDAQLTLSDVHVAAIRAVVNSGTLVVETSAITSNGSADSPGDVGGCINNAGSCTLVDSVVEDCLAGFGGGINNAGTLSVVGSVLSHNRAQRQGGAVRNDGGTATIEDSTIEENSALDAGGGLRGSFTIRRTRITGNAVFASLGEGGGLSGGGTVEESTVDHNFADFGGGISGSVTLVNSTVSGNVASYSGGGISGTAVLSNATVTDNESGSLGGGASAAGGGVSGTATARNSIIAGNRDVFGLGPDCAGTIVSEGYDLVGSLGTGCALAGTSTGNLVDVDPLLAPLTVDGGTTPTHRPLPGSPAIDAGSPTTCEPGDQRGVARPSGGCDIGAFEVARLAILKLQARPNTSSTGDNGYVKMKARFPTAPPTEILDTSAGLTLRVTDAAALDVSYAWSAAECLPLRHGRIRCRTADGQRQIAFTPSRSKPGVYTASVTCRGDDLAGPLGAPFDVSLSLGTTVFREGTIASCVPAAAGGVRCVQPG